MQTLADTVGPVPQNLDAVEVFISGHPIVSGILAVVALVVAVLGYLAFRAAYRAGKRVPVFLASRIAPRPAEDTLTVIAAGIATVVSASGMWQFFERIMPGVDWPWRLVMFAFIEVAVITSAVRAKRSMKAKYSAGVDGIAVWTLTSLSAVLSAMEAASLPEGVFRLAAPLVAAWLWERGMAIERHRITGLAGIHWRITPERILVRLGLAEAKDRTADEVDRQRRFTRVALAAKKVRVLREAGAKAKDVAKAQAKLETAYAAAHAHTGLGRDKELQETLAAETRSLFSAGELVNLEAASAWTKPAAPGDLAKLIEETQRMSDGIAALGEARTALEEMRNMREEMRAMESNVTMLASDATRRVTRPATHGQVTSGVTKKVTEPPVFVPQEWTAGAPAATPPATPVAVAERVTPKVTFDVTNPAAYDLRQSLLGDPSVTELVTPAVTPPAVTGRVTKRITFKSKPDPQPKTAIMREYWDKVRVEEKRYPGPVELARAAGAHPSLASRLRIEWVKELPWGERRRANPKPKKLAAVNGSTPTS
ncbi:hypothetical protein [Streptosporangium canum]|uniref:hypothetical protein n=1 Tax=Streptosporangium canum TaxID=324952 RepID=UPI0033AD71C5